MAIVSNPAALAYCRAKGDFCHAEKPLPAYLDEMEFRFNNRKNPFLFRDTVKRMLNVDKLEFKALTAA